MNRSEENRAIDEVIDRLAKLFPELPDEEVAMAVSQVQPEFDDAPIREYVPLFVERSAKARLRQSVH
jgi:cobalamin-dependent methionine synthase I